MDRIKKVLSYLAPKHKKPQPPKWKDLSAAWKACIIVLFFGPSAVYFSAVILSLCPSTVVNQYLPWLSLMTMMDICETAGIISIVVLARAVRMLAAKPAIQESFKGLAFCKLMMGWIGPFTIFVMTHMKGSKLNNINLHDGLYTSPLDFLPELKSTLEGSAFLQGRLLYAQSSVFYLFGLPLALIIYVGHRIWRYWKATRAQGGIVLSGEDELAVGQGEDVEEKVLMSEREPTGTMQMV